MKTPFLELFQQFQIIHCLCPNCNIISRLSDFRIFSREKRPKTWLDIYDSKLKKIENEESKFDEEEQAIRDLAHARAQKQVPRLILKAMNERFSKKKIDPFDIKPILHPVEFVLFDGLHKDNLRNVAFLAYKSNSSDLTRLKKQISDSIKEKRYDWSVARVSNDGNVEYE